MVDNSGKAKLGSGCGTLVSTQNPLSSSLQLSSFKLCYCCWIFLLTLLLLSDFVFDTKLPFSLQLCFWTLMSTFKSPVGFDCVVGI